MYHRVSCSSCINRLCFWSTTVLQFFAAILTQCTSETMRQPHLLLLLAAFLLLGHHARSAADHKTINSYTQIESVGAVPDVSVRQIANKAAAGRNEGAKKGSNPRHKHSRLPKLPLRRRTTPDPGDAGQARYSPFALTQQMAKRVYLEELISLLFVQCFCNLAKQVKQIATVLSVPSHSIFLIFLLCLFPSSYGHAPILTLCHARRRESYTFRRAASSRVTQGAQSALLHQVLPSLNAALMKPTKQSQRILSGLRCLTVTSPQTRELW